MSDDQFWVLAILIFSGFAAAIFAVNSGFSEVLRELRRRK